MRNALSPPTVCVFFSLSSPLDASLATKKRHVASPILPDRALRFDLRPCPVRENSPDVSVLERDWPDGLGDVESGRPIGQDPPV